MTDDWGVSRFIHTDSEQDSSGKRERYTLDWDGDHCRETDPDDSSDGIAKLNETDRTNRFEPKRAILTANGTRFQDSVTCNGNCSKYSDNCACAVERPDCEPFERPVERNSATREFSVAYVVPLLSLVVSGDPQDNHPAGRAASESQPKASCCRLDRKRSSEEENYKAENGRRIVTGLVHVGLSSHCDGGDASDESNQNWETNYDCERHRCPTVSGVSMGAR